MRLTPLDIQQKRFGKALRGYAVGEVETYLEAAAAELEARVKENLDLQEELKRKDARLEELDGRERALHDALVSAQRVATDIKDAAKKEAELVVVEAQLQAEKIVADAHARRVQLVEEINELKRHRARFEAGLEGLIEGHRRLLEATRGEDPAVPLDENVAPLHKKGKAG